MVGTYFDKGQVLKVEGNSKSYVKVSDAGRSVETKFCPECGSTVYWFAEVRPDSFGVAVGCFADPSFPAPGRAIWAQHKLSWVPFPEGLPVFDRQTT